jgi:hypothetical protein
MPSVGVALAVHLITALLPLLRFTGKTEQLDKVMEPAPHVPCRLAGNCRLVRSTLPMFLTVRVTVVPVAYASVTSTRGWLVALFVETKKNHATIPADTTVASSTRTTEIGDIPFLFNFVTEK